MSIDERSRHALYLRLEDVLGPGEASTLMEHLPPVGWADVATKQDLDHLGESLRHEMTSEFRAVRQEMETMRHEIVGTLRFELAAQTRAMFIAIVTIVLTMAALTFALAR